MEQWYAHAISLTLAMTRFQICVIGGICGLRCSFESDLITLRGWLLSQLLKFIKYDFEVLVMGREFSNNGCELAIQFLIRFQHLSSFTKARMIMMLTAMACSLLRTVDNIATPCSVKT
jgi:hypothetical protein